MTKQKIQKFKLPLKKMSEIGKEISELKEETKKLKMLFFKKADSERIEKCGLRINRLEKMFFELQKKAKNNLSFT